MILGNFMLLCEFHPDEVYRWFMEFFIDSYDWVMVPNIYGMSQHADGGLMTTKPYISGSSYVLKMSDFKKGEWCLIWDSLYWNFVAKQRSILREKSTNASDDQPVGQDGAQVTRASVASSAVSRRPRLETAIESDVSKQH
jgi:deoxyribodipyrimidine photolyase-like uncharacterized protein